MPVLLKAHNVILFAQAFNPSIVSPLWLHKHKIVDEVEFRSERCFYTPQIVRVETPEFEFLVIPDRLQFNPNIQSASAALVERVVGTFVRTLPHTPYSAVGFNFLWSIAPPDGVSLESLTRRLFFCVDAPYASEVDSGGSLFGGVFIKSALGGTIKIEAQPQRDPLGGNGFLGIAINYHFDLAGDQSVERLTRALARWQELRDDSARIARSFG
jgi:hypothetical protein